MNTLESTHTQRPDPFYLSVLEQELRLGRLTTSDKILVTCGGNQDRLALVAAGFTDAVITNLAPHHGHADYYPYSWEYQDNESLKYEDLAVHTFGGLSGGVANTEIPNLVYHFNEREVSKCARPRRPWGESPIRFYRALRLNSDRFRLHGSWLLRTSFNLAYPAVTTLSRVFKSLNNNVCFVIQVPEPANCHPWIRETEGKLWVNPEYLQAKYGKFSSKPQPGPGF